jgi:hypothetical protein
MIFNLFNTKVKEWEKALLTNIFSELGGEWLVYKQQIDDGLLRGVYRSSSPIPNYVGFKYNSVVSKYETPKAGKFILSGITVFDSLSNQFIEVKVHFYAGLIMGYSTPNKQIDLNPERYKTEGFKKEYQKSEGEGILKSVFGEVSISGINTYDIYEVEIDRKMYYHLIELEDGDFIGFDKKKNLYMILLDPFEIVLLDSPLEDVVSQYGQ